MTVEKCFFTLNDSTDCVGFVHARVRAPRFSGSLLSPLIYKLDAGDDEGDFHCDLDDGRAAEEQAPLGAAAVAASAAPAAGGRRLVDD